MFPWENETQQKNLAWMLPRPNPSKYPGSMPLHCEEWLIQLAKGYLWWIPNPKILTLFAGKSKCGLRVDIKPEVNPDVCCDVHELTKHIHGKFEIIIADPPYSNEEAQKLYGTPPLNFKKWTSEAIRLLAPDGIFIIYHKYLVPNPDPKKLRVVKRVFIGHRAWHTPRVAIFFQNVEAARR